MTTIPQLEITDEKLLKLLREKDVARTHQERKHDDWNDNYELYRNKVSTNRLTQRQAVNIPLMKETVKTILTTIDEPPIVHWQEKSGNELKELIYQEMWDDLYKQQNLDWVDILDKKNVLLYGISTKMINVGEDNPEIDVLDVWDIVYDPIMNPIDIETARFVIRQNIFRSLREILADDRYSEEGKKALMNWADSEDAIIQSGNNKEEIEKKQLRLEAMGVSHSDFDTFSAGDVVINLTEHYSKTWDKKKKKFILKVYVYADDWTLLLEDTVKNLTGIDSYPFVKWQEDPETNDVYPDGIADLVRTPNKILNVWFSQLVENRTLQNFQMHWYDATVQNYTPQTYEPGPGRMLPAPGKPSDVIMPVDINGLDETFEAINLLTTIVERGSGAVAIQKGIAEQSTQTLGEVEILVGKAQERSIAMQKFYRGSWYQLAKKWNEMMHANPPKKMKLFRTGRSGKMYEKTVLPSDWKGDYEPEVISSAEKEQDKIKEIQKFMFVQQQFPENKVLRRISQQRELESLDLTPGELKEIEDEEANIQEQLKAQNEQAIDGQQQNQQPQPQPQPAQPADPNANALRELEDSLGQLQ